MSAADPDHQRVLGIETSCDETAAAVVAAGRRILSSVVASQIDLHARFGGVVPELAGRAHLELLTPVVAEALERAHADGRPPVDAVAVTCGPGLVGSLLVGLSHAKALAMAWDVPFVGVNHLEGHLFASLLDHPELEWPLVVLLVSGGHTVLVLVEGVGRYRLFGQTLDDAAGEAFDKVARYLGLGYPGGPAVDREAVHGDPSGVRVPAGHARRRLRLLLLRPQDRGGPHGRQGARCADRRRRGVVPRGRRRRAGEQGPPGGGGHRREGAVPGRGGGRELVAAAAHRRGVPGRRRGGAGAEPRHVHRQRGDGGGGGTVALGPRRPEPAVARRRSRTSSSLSPLRATPLPATPLPTTPLPATPLPRTETPAPSADRVGACGRAPIASRRPRRGPDHPVRLVVCPGHRSGAPARCGRAGHGRSPRGPVGPHGAVEGLGRAGVRLLHQLREPQGQRAGGQPPRRLHGVLGAP